MKRFVLALVATLVGSGLVVAQDARAYPPAMPGASAETYKTVGQKSLKLYVYQPEGFKPTDKRPAIVFFFGGGWTNGSPRQFVPQCKYFAQRGMVAIAADYRVASRDQVKAVDCLRDAKSALRYVRKNAVRLGIDTDKIVAAGGSAGGHLAAACGTIANFDEPSEETGISSKPNALLLFNPAVMLAPVDGIELDGRRAEGFRERMGVDPREISPYHHVAPGVPPTAVFHGKADRVVPFATVDAFAAAMKKAGNTCELFGYEDEGHGFFNHGRGAKNKYAATLKEADKFLARLGYLQGPPAVEEAPPVE